MSKCNQCGTCCKLFLINLSEEEYNSRRFKTMFDDFISDFKEAEIVGANLLAQKEDGSCFYLRGNTCSIHGIRPAVCKPFFCSSKEEKFKEMIKMVQDYRSTSHINSA